MKQLLKADLFRVYKSMLSRIALILALAFPVLIALMFLGFRAIAEIDSAMDGDMLFNANTILGSVYSLSNNIGLVVPAFAGILVCTDCTSGTLRNKVIAGNRRAAIYLSHLIVSILFSVVIITIYAAVTAGITLLFFPFSWDADALDLGREIVCFIANGTMTFVFMATFTTMLAMIFRNAAPTIIFTVVFGIVLYLINTIVGLLNYESYKYAVYFIPTFAGNTFNLNNFSLLGIFGQTAPADRGLIFAEGMLSYLFFGAVHTVIGLFAFKKRDIR